MIKSPPPSKGHPQLLVDQVGSSLWERRGDIEESRREGGEKRAWQGGEGGKRDKRRKACPGNKRTEGFLASEPGPCSTAWGLLRKQAFPLSAVLSPGLGPLLTLCAGFKPATQG